MLFADVQVSADNGDSKGKASLCCHCIGIALEELACGHRAHIYNQEFRHLLAGKVCTFAIRGLTHHSDISPPVAH